MPVCTSQNTTLQSVLSFHPYLSSRDQTQITRLVWPVTLPIKSLRWLFLNTPIIKWDNGLHKSIETRLHLVYLHIALVFGVVILYMLGIICEEVQSRHKPFRNKN